MDAELKRHFDTVDAIFKRAAHLTQLDDVKWRPMRLRTEGKRAARYFTLGYTDLQKRLITVDILTPKKREVKSYGALLRVIAHELAHLQKPPFRQKYRGRWINRIHYPEFYKQVSANVEQFKGDTFLMPYFENEQPKAELS